MVFVLKISNKKKRKKYNAGSSYKFQVLFWVKMSWRIFRRLKFTYVPLKPSWNPINEPILNSSLNDETLSRIEALSLMDIKNIKERQQLEDAISLATRLHSVNTEGVEPLYMLSKVESKSLRPDVVKSIISAEEIRKSAEKTSDGFYTTNTSNINQT